MIPSSRQTDSEVRSEVVGAPIGSRTLVVAGPGTGKSHTLLRRAHYLLEEEEMELDRLLMLGFSRTTVETLTVRAVRVLDLGYLPISTLDSLATRMIAAERLEPTGGFEQRIKHAWSLVNDGGCVETLGRVRHALIDEAQDIVGARLDLVCEIIKRIVGQGGGFTIFGDHAQAIYDFQVQGENPENLLSRLPSLGVEFEMRQLTDNYRMRNEELARMAREYGAMVRTEIESPDVTLKAMKEELCERNVCSIDELPAELDLEMGGPQSGTCGVLCRTNADVLQVAGILHSSGIPLRVHHRAEDRGAAPWIATLFGDANYTTTSFPSDSDLRAGNGRFSPPPDAAVLLRRAGIVGGSEIDLGALAGLIRRGSCPQSLIATSNQAISVSTIHRAKGLEFDSVYVVETGYQPPAEAAADEARVIYVALTRASSELYGVGKVPPPGPFLRGSRSDRVVLASWPKRSRPRFVEIRVSDSDPDWSGEDRDEFESIQQMLASQVGEGDSLEFRLFVEDPDQGPVYEIAWRDRVVGRTSSEFGRSLKRIVKGRVPKAIHGLYADIPDCAAMEPAGASQLGLGSHGLHLRIRPYGLGELRWN